MNRVEGFIFYRSSDALDSEIPTTLYLAESDTDSYMYWTCDKESATVFTILDSDAREFLKDFEYYKSPAIAYREVHITTGEYEKFDKVNNG